MEIRPQNGPQVEFLSSRADIVIFGGGAGGGKTYGLLLECLRWIDNPHYSAIIFRRTSTQVRNPGGLWDTSTTFYPAASGYPKESSLQWIFPSGAKIIFAHMEYDKDRFNYQGAQIPLICCEENTLILTNKGSKKIKDLKIGDLVKTLTGYKKITCIGLKRLEDCVECNGQIHSTTHKLLTARGWISYSDGCKFCGLHPASSFLPNECYFVPKYAQYFEQKFLEFLQQFDKKFYYLWLTQAAFQSTLDLQVLQDFFSYMVLQVQDNEFESFENDNSKLSQQISTLLGQVHFLQFLHLKEYLSHFSHVLYEALNAPNGKGFEDFLNHYFVYCHQYDVFAQKIKDNDLGVVLQLNGVVQQNQTDLPFHEKDKVQKHIPHKLRYVHPYTGQEHFVEGSQISFQSLQISPIGKRWVIDLTVEGENHYITQSGLVNKNCFDELSHFSWEQFVYMFSRNRSVSGIPGYIRATTNPDPDSWVRKMIDWWLDDNGYPIAERSGKLRWFVIINDKIEWASNKQELINKFSGCLPKSLTFIRSLVHDNQILLQKDPSYLASLQALPRYEREQLLMGNWNIRPTAGMFFQRSFFPVVEAIPAGTTRVRYWDRAATKKTETNDPDFTVGIKLEKDQRGVFYVTDVCSMQDSPLRVQNAIRNMALQDGVTCQIGIEQDPGQAGVSEVDLLIRMLAGFIVKPYKVQKDKVTRASPVSAQCEAGNIKILRAKWNEDFFRELENFPEGLHDDQVDAFSGAFLMHAENKYDITSFLDAY